MTSQLLDFGSDIGLRRRWFTQTSFGHPAKLHLGLLQWIVDTYTLPGQRIADPMSGVGSVLYAATMQRSVVARELEAHWIELMRENAAHITEQAGLFAGHIDIGQADAREPWGYQANHIITSPPYACEASTTPNPNRGLRYRLRAGQVPYGERWQKFLDQPTQGSMGMVTFHYGRHPAQIGHLRGTRYWEAMRQVYTQARMALRPGGYLILILKDHIALGLRVPTTQHTIALCESLGFQLSARHQRRIFPLSLWQRRRKEAGLPVVEEEDVLVFSHGRL